MSSDQNLSSNGSIMEPFKLTITLSLSLLTLPSLFFSLILFSLLSFFLLLPLLSTLLSIHLLCSILSRIIPLTYTEVYTPKHQATEENQSQVEQDCIELDCREVPRFEESSSSASSSFLEEKEKFMKELEEMDHDQFCQLLERFYSAENDGFMTFAEILAFWRNMERRRM